MYRLLQLVRIWWNGADESSLSFLLRGAAGYLLVWMVLPSVGIDRLTTVNNFTAISVTLSGIACGLGVVCGWRAWFGLRDDKLVGARRRMKRDQRGKWVIGGFLSMILPALILTYATKQFTGVAAQLLPGAALQYRGTVTTIHRILTARSQCRVRASIELDNAQGTTTFCLNTSDTSAVDSLAEGDTVVLNEKRGVFGQSVESVEHVPR
jgi:hypothetical protein